MDADGPINKPLIFISFVVIILYNASFIFLPDTSNTEPTFAAYIMTSIALMIVIPLLVIWFKALWNEIVPRVTAWRPISYVEAFGVMTLLLFLSSDL